MAEIAHRILIQRRSVALSLPGGEARGVVSELALGGDAADFVSIRLAAGLSGPPTDGTNRIAKSRLNCFRFRFSTVTVRNGPSHHRAAVVVWVGARDHWPGLIRSACRATAPPNTQLRAGNPPQVGPVMAKVSGHHTATRSRARWFGMALRAASGSAIGFPAFSFCCLARSIAALARRAAAMSLSRLYGRERRRRFGGRRDDAALDIGGKVADAKTPTIPIPASGSKQGPCPHRASAGAWTGQCQATRLLQPTLRRGSGLVDTRQQPCLSLWESFRLSLVHWSRPYSGL